ncbi:MAG: helix-turn-helix domain-containing protein [Novosphingobium sp.]
MASVSNSSNKAKIAKRVIEVLDYFDDDHREATVMDIVRRYNRPQSSTSELLSSLVDLGLLYKDPYSRSYSLSPRAALLGTNGQTGMARDGRVVRLIDRLAAQTGLSVALYGMVGLNAQIVSWRSGNRQGQGRQRALWGGMQEPLLDSAVGWLMLSTVGQPRRDGVVRRLIAEASEDRKQPFTDMTSRIQNCADTGTGVGIAGFGTSAEVVSVLLPGQPAEHPMAIGLVFAPDSQINVESLVACIREAIAHCLLGEETAPVLEAVAHAA